MTALDFYLTLKDREELDECRGPIVYLKLNSAAANRLYTAAAEIEVEPLVRRAFITLVSEDVALFGSCMAHWTDLSSIAYAVGGQMGRPDIKLVGEIIFRKVCNILGWDHRELDNYLVSLSSGGEDTDDFVC